MEREQPEQQACRIITFLRMHVDQRVQEQVATVYHQLTPHLLDSSPALQESALAKSRDADQQESYLIVSQWNDVQAYQAWESSDEHRRELRPLVRLVDGLSPETFYCVVS